MAITIIVAIVAVAVALLIAVPITCKVAVNNKAQKDAEVVGTAEDRARSIIDEALKAAETKKREALLEVKEESLRTKNELEKETKERRSELQKYERRVLSKEESVDKKADAVEKREAECTAKVAELQKREKKVDELEQKGVQELERISGLTSDQAKDELLRSVEDDVKVDVARLYKELESRAKEEAGKKAKEYVVNAIQKCAVDHVSETTISVVQLPSDEMKGRIIGREGRNIRTLETLTGVDLIIDDTPEAVVLSAFDPIRREIARVALEKLIVDGRIHPARIEEMVEKAQKEVEAQIREDGENAAMDVGVHGIHPELLKLLGRMKFRTSYGQNAFFYDAAEGVLTAAILLIAEFCPDGKRHIISVFKLIQDLLAPSKVKGKNQFQLLLAKLPDTHKAKWFAGAALNTAEQSMQSVLSTALSRLNAFLDSELEQILCFDTAIDAELFCKQKTAVFLVMPEEDNTKYFIISLILQQLYREILVVADENGGKLDNRVVFYWDEVGTIPKIESAEMMFSASRSRRVSIVPMIQSFAQLNKNYGKEGAEIIIDNCQDTIFGGFAPNSESAEVLSKSLGNKTVMSGSISRGKNDPSQSLQMIQRPLMTADELKSLSKGNFIVSKTGTHPMRTKLKLFLKWGITFEEPYEIEEKSARKVAYADKQEIEEEIIRRYMCCMEEPDETPAETARTGGMQQTPLTDTMKKMRQTLRTED